MIAPILAAALSVAAPGTVVDRLAATVNDDMIILSELEERAGSEYRHALELPAGEARERAKSKVLRAAFDQLVAEKLLDAQVASLQIEVSDGEVDAAIDDIRRRSNLTDEQLTQVLGERGISRAEHRKQVKKSLEQYRILSVKVKNRIKVSDEDVKNYYQTHLNLFAGEEEIRVRDIFLAFPEKSTPTDEAKVKGKADKVLARIKGGEPFVKLAREVSQGPSAPDGGDLGYLRHGTLQPELARVAFGLKTGEVSGTVKTRLGYHILSAEDRRLGGAKPFEQVKEEIRDLLTNEQLKTFTDQYVAELRKDATIDVKLPELKGP